MVALLQEAYVPVDYEVQLHKRRMGLRQKDMDVSTYIEEFHNLVMKFGIVEPENLKLARYLQGLKLSIQDELSLTTITIVQQCFMLASKVEERSKRRSEQGGRGRGRNDRARTNSWTKGKSDKSDKSNKSSDQEAKEQGESSSRGHARGRRSFGRGRGRSDRPPKCYNHNQIRLYSNKCPKRANKNEGERRAQLVHEERDLEAKEGITLMMRLAFLQVPHTQEPPQRKNFF